MIRRLIGLIAVEDLQIGDVLVVMAGERVAADGKIISGVTAVDESSVTGESLPVEKAVGADVLGGDH